MSTFPSNSPAYLVGASCGYDRDLDTVHAQIAKAAQRNPNAKALCYEGAFLTYGALLERALAVAQALVAAGLQKGEPVVIMTDKSLAFVVGVLGVWHAGGFYVPLDPEYPDERLSVMLRVSRARYGLTHSFCAEKAQSLGERAGLSSMMDLDQPLPQVQPDFVFPRVTAADPAYMIFTSGTSGIPKGVLNSHRSVLNLMLWYRDVYGIKPGDIFSQLPSLSFDASIGELFPALMLGAQVRIFPSLKKLDPAVYIRDSIAEGVSFATLSPTYMKLLLSVLDASLAKAWTSLRWVLLGGEACPYATVYAWQDLFGERVQVVNIYGPTEATVFSTSHPIAFREPSEDRALVPIGKPLINEWVIVRDDAGSLCSVGEPGELCIGGDGLAIGYDGDPEKTTEVFVNIELDGKFQRIYRTGDKAFLNADGEIEFLGRLTDQVKIKGYRVELQEVISHLARIDGIRDAFAQALKDPRETDTLIAYYTSLQPMEHEQLKAAMAANLPDFMVPARFIWVADKLPYTTSGKVDKQRLPPIDWEAFGDRSVYEAPVTEAEAWVSEVWSSVLRVPQVGRTDHFYMLGGDSISALRCVSQLNRRGYAIKASLLLSHPVLHELAARLGEPKHVMVQTASREVGPVLWTPIQKWFLSLELDNPSFHHQSLELEVDQQLDPERVARTIRHLADYHDMLRAAFPINEQGVRSQLIVDQLPPFEVQVEDASQLSQTEQTAFLEELGTQLRRAVDLDNAPVWRVALVRLSEQRTRLIWVMHHAIVDTVSWQILGDDFLETYAASANLLEPVLPAKTTSFKAWSQWQFDRDNQGSQRAQRLQLLDYWRPTLNARNHVAALPNPSAERSHSGSVSVTRFSLDPNQTTHLLEDTSFTLRTTVEDLILAALFRALAQWTGNPQIQIDVEWHGREALPDTGIDLSRTVGWFTTIHPLSRRVDLKDLRADLVQLKEQRRQLPEHGVSFNQLRFLSPWPEVRSAFEGYRQGDIVFNYSGLVHDRVGAWSIVPILAMENAPENPNPYEMAVETRLQDGQLICDFYASPERVSESSRQLLGETWLKELKQVIAYCQNPAHAERTPSDFPDIALNFQELVHLPQGARRVFPLSDLQSAMYFYADMYLVQVVYRMPFPFHIHLLQNGLSTLVQRHAALRTVILSEGFSQPVQVELDHSPIQLHWEDLTSLSEHERSALIDAFLRRDRKTSFDLSQAPLFRAHAWVRDADSFDLVLSVHHIIHDGWSLSLLMEELQTLYLASLKGTEAKLGPVLGDFSDFVVFQRTLATDPEERAFWSQNLADASCPHLPRDFHRPSGSDQIDNEIVFDHLGEAFTQQLRAWVEGRNLTLNDLFLSSYVALLHFLCQSDSVLLGIITSGRDPRLPDYEQIIGCCVNTLPLRVNVQRDNSLLALAEEVHRAMFALGDHLSFPLSQILELAKPADHKGPFELFETLYNFESHQYVAASDDTPAIPAIVGGFETTNYPVSFGFFEEPDNIAYKITYMPTVYMPQTITRWVGFFKNLLQALISQPESQLASVEWLGNDERNRLLVEFNNTATPYAEEQTLQAAIEHWVVRQPDALAVTFKERQLSYGALNAAANQLARHLRHHGAGPDQLIGLMVDRTEFMLIGLLGILKSGAAYIPIDPTYPEHRIEYMLEHSGAQLLVVHQAHRGHRGGIESDAREQGPIDFSGKIVDMADASLFSGRNDNPNNLNSSRDLAYVIYTSGSTGKPKGVMIEHRNALNFVVGMNQVCQFEPNSCFLALTTICFDIFFLETVLPLVNGMRVVIADEAEQMDPQRLNQLIAREKVDVLQATPARMRLIVNQQTEHFDDFSAIRKICVGGEPFPEELLHDLWRTTDAELFNVYGPTETTVWSTVKKIPRGGTIDIGQPIANTQVYILDNRQALLPLGLAGELWIGGHGVGRGYLHRPDLTEERFIQNPFRPGERIYATGDLARWRADGSLECLGRIDFQVKIRGFRVELGEIEARMLAYPAIKEAVATARPLQGVMTLCAYYVSTEAVDGTDLRAFVAMELPDYMVPTYFVSVEHMPLSPGGKVNRNALPDPQTGSMDRVFVAPRNAYETQVHQIWSEVLGIPVLGVTDSFFDLGGHSLKAISLVSRINRFFKTRLSFASVFQFPTIEALAAHIDGAHAHEDPVLTKAPVQHDYPLSFQQDRLYSIQYFDPTATVYNMPAAFELHGALFPERIEAALLAVIQRHEALHTVFSTQAGTTRQHLLQPVSFQLEQTQVSSFEEAIAGFVRPFDLTQLPFRARLAVCGPEHGFLLLDMHHLVSDGSSTTLLARDFSHAYNEGPLEPLSFHYKDYAVWQRSEPVAKMLARQEHYWRKVYQNLPTVLELPTDFPRPAIRSDEGARFGFSTPPELGALIQRACRQLELTPFMFLLAGFKVLLARYSGQDDLVVGTPVAGRGRPELEDVFGVFVNTVTLRTRPQPEKTFEAYASELRQVALDGYANQDYPFEALIEKIGVTRDLSRNPLFDVMFMQDHVAVEQVRLAGLDVHHRPLNLTVSRVDLLLTFREETTSTYWFGVEYCSKLFAPETLERFQGHYLTVLANLANHPEQHLGQTIYLTEEERLTILTRFNQPLDPNPCPQLFPLLFEAQVLRYPDLAGLELDARILSFAELNAQINRLAHYLRAQGVVPGFAVGLACTRSVEMVIGLYAILKAGGYYVPIDQDWPIDRATTVIGETAMSLALVETEKAAALIESATDGQGPRQLPLLELLDPAALANGSSPLSAYSPENPQPLAGLQDLAYIIFTSGTTGKPKGVLSLHQNLANLTLHMATHFYKPGERCSQIVTYCFDGSLIELAGALPSGATLCLCPPVTSLETIIDYVADKRLTNLLISPSPLKQIMPLFTPERVARLDALQKVFSGGEALEVALVKELQQRFDYRLQFINVYGPTETTVFSTNYPFDPKQLVNEHGIACIGAPIRETHVYILDRANQLCPVGIEGEIWISGAGLARGYLNDPEQTARKFHDSPFVAGQRIYGTGDLGKWRPDGKLDILGRKDDQVKIRGFRIEISEVESTIQRQDLVREAVVLAREVRSGEKSLVAYVVLEPGLNLGSLKALLKTQLPDYMVPAYFVAMDAFPINQSGKVDKKALPEPDLQTQDYVPPRHNQDAEMIHLWEEVLGTSPIGIDDNFFDKGGHSLKAMSLAAFVGRHFSVELPIKELFLRPTVRELVDALPQLTVQVFQRLEPAHPAAYYPVSSQQRRLYTLHQFDRQATTYNMPSVFRINWEPNPQRIQAALAQVVAAHEAFRTHFVLVDGHPVQVVVPHVNFQLHSETRLGAQPADLIGEFIQPFDLESGPLLRASLIQLGAADYLLLLDMHHIISDGVSMGLLAMDFDHAYQGGTLCPRPVHYKDYAVWQNGIQGHAALERQKAYWRERLSNPLPTLDLPSDFARPAIQSFEGARARFRLGPELAQRLRQFCRNHDATAYMVLLATTNLLLARISGQEELLIGSPVAGRDRSDLEQIIGMFVNTLVFRSQPTPDKRFADYLAEVRALAMEAFQNQSYPFEDLLDHLNLTRDLSRNPLFDVMFLVQNLDMNDLALDGRRAPYVPFEAGIAKFDLSFIFYDQEELGFELELEYATRLFKSDRIQRLGQHLLHLIEEVCSQPDQALAHYELLNAEQRQVVLHDFNQTQADLGPAQTLDAVFSANVARRPNEVALELGDQTLTFHDLDQRSNQLAHYLRQQGLASPDAVVPVICERSFEMLIAIFAILKAGAAYLPISPENPEDRTQFILEDSCAQVVLTCSGLAPYLQNNRLDLDGLDRPWSNQASTTPPSQHGVTHLAYIIYTSGSTGKPKGVMIEHRTVFNMLAAMQVRYPMVPGDAWLLKTAYTFDVSVTELFGWIFGPGHLAILEPGAEKDPVAIGAAVTRHQVTHLNFVPSMLSVFLAAMTPDLQHALSGLKQIHVAGEAFSLAVHKALEALALPARIENIYGPTEATIYSTWFSMAELGDRRSVPIGQPVTNARAYVLDARLHLVPIGVPGELCIAGAGLARGYLNRPELTEEKFIPDPFVPGQRLYRTGDLVAWAADGHIEYLGRIDHQAKVRGYRIELGEIETQLSEFPLVDEAVVTVRHDEYGTAFLCAYVVGAATLSSTALREHLARCLPDYMIPAHFVALDALPLNPSGKVDRKALPDPTSIVASDIVYVGPRDNHELVVVTLWQEVLGLERVGIHDDFFALGGHSLIAIRLVPRFEDHGYTVGLNDLFRYRTAAELAARIAANQRAANNVQSLEEGLRQFRAEFDCAAETRTYTLDQRSFLVLYTDAVPRVAQTELVVFIGNAFSQETLPHYIRPLAQLPAEDHSFATQRELSLHLGLQTEFSPAQEAELVRTAFAHSHHYAKDILRSPEACTYGMSPIQIGHLTLTVRPAGGMLVFKDYIDLERFNQAFTHLVGQQGLLRSRPDNSTGTWIWHELNPPPRVELPFMDFTHLDLDLIEDQILKLMGKFFFYDYRYDDGTCLPYNFLLIRQNLREYLLIFTADHIIYDAMSDEIVKNAILQAYYQGLESAKAAGSTYQTYVTQTLRGPQGATAEELIEAFQLDRYKPALKNLDSIVSARARKDLRILSLDVRLKDQALTERTPFEVAFAIFIRFVGAYLELDNLPLTLVSYGRRYEDQDYFGTIGEFVDQVPIYVPVGNHAFDHVRAKLDMAVRHNVNFMSLMFDERLRQQWAQVVECFSSEDHTYIESLVRFNFQGKGNPEEMGRMKRFLDERLPLDRPTGAGVVELRGILFEVLYHDRTLRISLSTSLDGSLPKLRALLARLADEEVAAS